MTKDEFRNLYRLIKSTGVDVQFIRDQAGMPFPLELGKPAVYRKVPGERYVFRTLDKVAVNTTRYGKVMLNKRTYYQLHNGEVRVSTWCLL